VRPEGSPVKIDRLLLWPVCVPWPEQSPTLRGRLGSEVPRGLCRPRKFLALQDVAKTVSQTLISHVLQLATHFLTFTCTYPANILRVYRTTPVLGASCGNTCRAVSTAWGLAAQCPTPKAPPRHPAWTPYNYPSIPLPAAVSEPVSALLFPLLSARKVGMLLRISCNASFMSSLYFPGGCPLLPSSDIAIDLD
jgi:hypothetical protein